jgi:hypothetical protein
MQHVSQNGQKMRPCGLATKDGQPAIQWWCHGNAAKGEPSTVYEVTVYPTEKDRDAAFFSVADPLQ